MRDKRLLVYAEQGLSDQIMFASCLPDLLPQVGGCVVECAPRLVPIFRRSFPAARIKPQARDDASLASLVQAACFDYWSAAIDHYDETAALVTALDLVISVQTAVVHLAGALGKPAWVLVPAVPEWRYLKSGDSMPWYSSLRLFRQWQAN
jgi:hypothetical protein